MGTRGAYGFHKDGVDKITYNHFDSYPIGLGADVAAFVCQHTDEEMNAIFDRIILVATNEKPTGDQIAECMPFFDGNVSEQTPEDWYCLLRKAQGNLEAYAGGLRYMVDQADFLKDSLFCEWGYVINLDKGVLEIYRGFQRHLRRTGITPTVTTAATTTATSSERCRSQPSARHQPTWQPLKMRSSMGRR